MTAEQVADTPSGGSPSAALVLDVAGLTKSYGDVTAVNGISFQISAGEIFGLLGPNGAGKTTTISVIATLLKPSGGSVSVSGNNARNDSMAVRRLIGLVPQDIGLYLRFSAWANLEFFGNLYGLWGRSLRQRIEEVLEVVGLTDSAKKPIVTKFSGGMKRRLNLATGLLHKPRLLLLDEPTVGVDPQSRNRIFENIKSLAKDDGTAILYTTHYVEEAETLCDRVAIIDGGEIVVCDAVPKLLAQMPGVTFTVELGEESVAFEASVAERSGITEVTRVDGNGYRVVAEDQEQGLAALLATAREHQVTLAGLDIAKPNLEQLFLRLTGKALRD